MLVPVSLGYFPIIFCVLPDSPTLEAFLEQYVPGISQTYSAPSLWEETTWKQPISCTSGTLGSSWQAWRMEISVLGSNKKHVEHRERISPSPFVTVFYRCVTNYRPKQWLWTTILWIFSWGKAQWTRLIADPHSVSWTQLRQEDLSALVSGTLMRSASRGTDALQVVSVSNRTAWLPRIVTQGSKGVKVEVVISFKAFLVLL